MLWTTNGATTATATTNCCCNCTCGGCCHNSFTYSSAPLPQPVFEPPPPKPRSFWAYLDDFISPVTRPRWLPKPPPPLRTVGLSFRMPARRERRAGNLQNWRPARRKG